MDAFVEAEAELAVHVYPSHLADVNRAVADRLSRLLMRYNEELGGVPISFADMRLVDSTGRIFRDQPHVHLRVLATFLIFAPAVGKPLAGTVTLMGPDHVGLLVNGVFNASIPSAKIPPAFRPDAGETNRLVNQLTGQIIEAGAEVTFTVTAVCVGAGGSSLETLNTILTIAGSLLPEDGSPMASLTPSRKAAGRPKVPLPRLANQPPRVRAEKRRAPATAEAAVDEDGADAAASPSPAPAPRKVRRREAAAE